LAEPLAEELRPEYYEYINPVKSQLDCIEYHEAVPQEDMLTLNQEDAITDNQPDVY